MVVRLSRRRKPIARIIDGRDGIGEERGGIIDADTGPLAKLE